MFDKLKKKSIKKSLFSVILLVVIGLFLIGVQFSSLMSLLKGHAKFETLAPDEIYEGLIVDASINTNFGYFAESYEENTDTHATRTTDLYYVIWTGDEDDEDFRYMGIKVPASDEDAMEAMAEATYYYEYSDPIAYSGTIKKMNDEEYKYFKEYFTDSDWTEEEVEDWTLPYYINVGALTGGAAATVYVIFGIGVVLVLLGIITFITALNGGKLKALKKELEAAGISDTETEYDYESARVFDEKAGIRIGRKLTYFMGGSKPHVIPNDKLVWAFQRTITHRTNGIKTGTTYEVVLNNYDKKSFHVSVKKEAMSVEILQYIAQNMPWVVVGYNDDLNKLFNKDYQNFLEICYNKARAEEQQYQF